MVTTNRLIPVDAFGSDPHDGLIHLTGLLQVVTRVTLGDPDGVPAHVELLLDAAQVRGVSAENGAKYQARGAYRFALDPKELPVPVDLVSAFELLGCSHGNAQPTRLLLVVPIHARVLADGRITMGIEDLKLLPCPSG
jgi:hypothetical protein